MEYRTLGRTGLEVGAIGLGTEHLEASQETRAEVLRIAVDAGVNYVDLLWIDPAYWEDFGPVLRPHRQGLVLAAHWGMSVEAWSNGDLNGDGLVDGADAAILTAHWGQQTTELGAVPEPGTLVLLVMGLLGMGLFRRQRREIH